MAFYPHQFNEACGDDDDDNNFVYFDGVAVNNEYFSQVRDCDDSSNEQKQLQFLDDLNTTVANAAPLPVHFSVSWNWDCCSCSSASYQTRYLDWGGANKSALEHMINIVDSVDVQVAYNTATAMRDRAVKSYEYWTAKPNKSSTSSALYVLAYTNPNYLCQISFSPHVEGSETPEDTCNIGNVDRTEQGMYSAFDFVESELPGIKGGIHFMNGVYASGITAGWPKHEDPTLTCSLDKKWKPSKNKCKDRCKKKNGTVYNWDLCECEECPFCTKWKNGRCRPRCNKKKKWYEDGGKCIKRSNSIR